MDHMCWTTGGQVRRVGLRAGRFVEVGLLRTWPRSNYDNIIGCFILFNLCDILYCRAHPFCLCLAMIV